MSILSKLPIDWAMELSDVIERTSIQSLFNTVDRLYEETSVLPAKENIFLSLSLTDFDNVKVVILGQDPYPNKSDAMGLAFSVFPGVKVPASLKNIYGEIERSLDIEMDKTSGDLTKWAEQGVLLLNTALTVEEGNANSHKNLFWIEFTSEIIKRVAAKSTPTIFMLWGRNAQATKEFIVGPNNYVFETSHPSPLGASKNAPIPFMGSGIFKKTNDILIENNLEPIDWRN